jgi:5-methylcytosine-specific restriction endonuclease McrA
MSVAHRKVLVLNKNWQAVGVVNMERAIALLYGNYRATGEPKAIVVDPDSFQTFTWADWGELQPKAGEDYIRSAKKIWKMPEVIVLSRYDKLPTHRVTFSRRTIWKRDSYLCQYCGKHVATEGTIDHVVPSSRGGQTNWTNCVLACLPCNARKANRTPEEAGMKLRRQPFKPKYQLVKGDIVCDSWKKFLSEAYWNVEMENDMPDPDEKVEAPAKTKKKHRKGK